MFNDVTFVWHEMTVKKQLNFSYEIKKLIKSIYTEVSVNEILDK